MDWSVEANVSERHIVSIFRTQMTILIVRRITQCGAKGGGSEEMGRSGLNKVEIEPGRWRQ